MTALSFHTGDVVARNDDVGVVVGTEPYRGPTVLWLPAGRTSTVEATTVRLVMAATSLASVLRTARDADDLGA